MILTTEAGCRECLRVFDLTDEDDAGEWAYGHDCEEPPPEPVLITDPRSDPHMDRNANGSWFCNRCRMTIILFDEDDEHDCTGRPWWLERKP